MVSVLPILSASPSAASVDELVNRVEAPPEPLGVRLAGVEAARREVRVVSGVAVGAHRLGRPHAEDV